jgi:type II secretory pathway component GspD/PulD (secretin)
MMTRDIIPVRYLLVLLLFAVAPIGQAGEQQMEILTLQHRLASELLPVLQPLVDKEGVITAKDNQLIIRSSPGNLVELKMLVRKLDNPPRRLLIEVRQPQSGSTEALQAGVSGHATLPEGSGQITLRTSGTTSRDTTATGQKIQVLEGHPALIKTGKQIPMARQQLRNGHRVETVIEQVDVSTGFKVIPRLTDDTVLLEIMPFSASQASGGGGIINKQEANTTISGKLGEWLEIGGASSLQRRTGQGTVYSTQSRSQEQRQILIRVTELK